MKDGAHQLGEKIRRHGMTAVLAAVSGALSFAHIHDLALHHGQVGWRSWTYPVSIDAVTAHALSVLLRSDRRPAVRTLAWIGVSVFTAVSLAANLLDANLSDPIGVFLSAAPVAAFLFSTLLAHIMVERPVPAPEPERERVPRTPPKTARRATRGTGRRAHATGARAVLEELAPAFLAQYGQGPARGRVPAFRQMGDPALRERGLEAPSREMYRRVLIDARA